MRTRGSTILELAVSIAVAAIAFMILGAIFLAQGRYLAIQDAVSRTQYSAFQTLDTFGLYASSAQAVVAGRTINGRAYTSGSSTVILQLPSISASGDIIAGAFDYVAFGRSQDDPTQFMFDIDAATNSERLNGQFLKAPLVDALIFRYNAAVPANATAVDVYVRTGASARGQRIRQPLGKIFYLGSS